jgi:AAA+ ATPase superfamily predicted ATPase
MGSPFIYEDPLEPPEPLAGRTAELILLRDRIAETRNSRLEGPRRYGKTSLLKAALAVADRDGFIPIYVNFLGVLTAGDVAERIERAYREQLEGSLQRWFAGVVATLRPNLKATPAGVGVELAPTTQMPHLLDLLALPRRLQERDGRQCAIAFDEFQDVVRAGDALTGTIRSELEQHSTVAAYIFSGSHPGLMRDLFSDRRHAFFAQAKPIDLPRLEAADLAEYVGARF